MQRRLSAIFAADMVGYSRLMEADEIGTLERQKVHRSELLDPKLEEFHGWIVKEMGDGLLVEFPSVVEAVQCAVIIQQGMEDREADTPDDLRIQYRIGINLGDIVIEGDDIFGDGVNIAARLEQMAEPGGICISGTAFDHLKSKVEVGYKSLGDVQVKNIKQPVHAYRVLTNPDQVGTVIEKQKSLVISHRLLAVVAVLLLIILSGGGSWWSQQPDVNSAKPNLATLKLPDKPSIAVLPFANLSNDAEQEYFVDGMTDGLITRLANVNSLFVIARNSVFTYKGKNVKVQNHEEAKKLLFGHRAEGSTATKDPYDQTFDKEGHWSFRISKFNSVSKGQTYLKDGKTCNLNRGVVKGLDDCFYVYRNPKGAREDRNEYKAVNANNVYSFSVFD